MAKKFIAKTHLADINGDIVAPGTEIEESLLGDAETIARYESLKAIEEGKDSVIVTGESAAGGETLDDTAEELNRHTRAELAEMAKAKKIEVGEKETKAEIIAKLLV